MTLLCKIYKSTRKEQGNVKLYIIKTIPSVCITCKHFPTYEVSKVFPWLCVTSKARISCWVRSLDAAHLVRSPFRLEMEISIRFWISSHWWSASTPASKRFSSLATIFPSLPGTLVSITRHCTAWGAWTLTTTNTSPQTCLRAHVD